MQKDDESYLVYDYIRRNASKKMAKAYLADIGLKSALAKARLRKLDITLESIFKKAGGKDTPKVDAQSQLLNVTQVRCRPSLLLIEPNYLSRNHHQ